MNNTKLIGYQECPSPEDETDLYYYYFDELGVCQGKATAVFTKDGATYYAAGGKLRSLWQEVSASHQAYDYYYFDPITFQAVDGEQTINGVKYLFENCILVRGGFVTNARGTRYYWAGNPLVGSWLDYEGKTYYCGVSGYLHKGVKKTHVRDGYEEKLFIFDDETGEWLSNANGLYPTAKGTYLAENGVALYYPGLVSLDGYYYYFNSTNLMVKDCDYSIGEAKTNGLLPAGRYHFDADGHLVLPTTPDPTDPTDPPEPTDPTDPPEPTDPTEPIDPTVKNGLIHDEDGKIRYYENGVAVYKGLVYDGTYYYYINSTKTAVCNREYSIGAAKTNGLLPAGHYSFDADCHMINPPVTEPVDPDPVDPDPDPVDPDPVDPDPDVKNGLVHDPDGKIRYYENGVALYKGLVYDGTYYYYINSTKTAVCNREYSIGAAKTNGLLPAGHYSFDADCHMINPPTP